MVQNLLDNLFYASKAVSRAFLEQYTEGMVRIFY